MGTSRTALTSLGHPNVSGDIISCPNRGKARAMNLVSGREVGVSGVLLRSRNAQDSSRRGASGCRC